MCQALKNVELDRIVCVIFDLALTDRIPRNQEFMNYYSRYLSGQSTLRLLGKVAEVRLKLAFAFSIPETGGMNQIHHIVGEIIWSFLGPEKAYPKIRPGKNKRIKLLKSN